MQVGRKGRQWRLLIHRVVVVHSALVLLDNKETPISLIEALIRRRRHHHHQLLLLFVVAFIAHNNTTVILLHFDRVLPRHSGE